jgi:hypothetical protein
MDEVKYFLDINGFSELKNNVFVNDKCYVIFRVDFYEVKPINNEWMMFSESLQIYWLIGVLTYYSFIDKNYKQA